MDRSSFLRFSGAVAAGIAFACSRSSRNAVPTSVASAGMNGGGTDTTKGAGAAGDNAASRAVSAGRKVLLVFFSRAGENYFHGGRKVLKIGNTNVVAGFIRDALSCDVYEIRPVQAYSDRYDPTVERNAREQDETARPSILDLPASLAAYDTVVIGSPVWNVRLPRIMLTFAEHLDFSGKTVYPLRTHAMSALGHAVEEYRAACRGATIGKGLAIRGEEAENSRPEVEAWLRSIHLLA